jgi:hypothetical protein
VAETERAFGKPIKRDLLLICLAAVAIRLPWIFTVPMAEAPDEFAHYWVIKFLHDHLSLPSAGEVLAGGPSAVYGSLPQLGYLPHVLLTEAFPASELTLYARFGSLLMGVVMICAAYYIGRELFPRQRLLALALPSLLVFHPQLVLLQSYANNDSTTAAMAAWVLYLMIVNLKQGITIKRSAILGCLLSIMVLGKLSGYCLFPAVVLYMVAAALLNGTSVVFLFECCALITAIVLSTTVWWFLRNADEFAGDFLGTKTMYHTWAVTFHKDLNYHLPVSHIIKEKRWWRMTIFSYWGMYGYMTRYLWRPVYIAYLVFMASAFGGWVLGVKQVVATKLAGREERVNFAIWSMLTLVLVTNLAAMIWASTSNLGGPQGRYLFPSEIPIMALMVAGLSRFGKAGDAVVISFLLFNAIVCLGAWVWLAPLYGFHVRPF